MARYLNPRTDIVFKKIFGEHPELLKSFLNSILPLPEGGDIVTLEYLSAEQIPEIPALKRSIVDVKCYDQMNRQFIVEMQLQWTSAFMQRMLFNASHAYVKQLDRGAKYNQLSPVYGISIINTIFDHISPEWYHHYKMVHTTLPELELKGLQFIFLELPKFKPNSIEQKKMCIYWLRFLSEINEKTIDADSELLGIPEIKSAILLAEEAAYTKNELESYYSYWDTVSTEKTLFDERYVEGKAEGKAEGVTEAQFNIARKMKTKGLSIEEIAELTGLKKEDLNLNGI